MGVIEGVEIYCFLYLKRTIYIPREWNTAYTKVDRYIALLLVAQYSSLMEHRLKGKCSDCGESRKQVLAVVDWNAWSE